MSTFTLNSNTVATLGVPRGNRLEVVQPQTFHSWKEIAIYLKRGVRTVQRWHSTLQLPVQRINNTRRSPVFAFRAELDQWLRTCAISTEHTPLSSSRPAHEALRTEAERAMKSAAQMISLMNQQSERLLKLRNSVNRLRARQSRSATGSFANDGHLGESTSI